MRAWLLIIVSVTSVNTHYVFSLNIKTYHNEYIITGHVVFILNIYIILLWKSYGRISWSVFKATSSQGFVPLGRED